MSFQGIDVVIFHPHFWIFDLGVRLNRYMEYDDTHQWIRKEFDLGLIVVGLRFNWIFQKKEKAVV